MPAERLTGNAVLDMLRGGDRRSIGRSDEVVRLVLREPKLFSALVKGMLAGDVLVRMRAADAAEKVTARHPQWLKPYRRILLWEIAGSQQQEVRWHLAQMLPCVPLGAADLTRATQVLKAYLEDRSSIVRTFAMQALADLAMGYPALQEEVLELLRRLLKKGTPAMVSRGRKLVKLLEQSARTAERSRGTRSA